MSIWAFVSAKCIEGIESLILLGNTLTIFTNPFKLYLNCYLDYHTSKAIADVTSIRNKEKNIPAVIRYLHEDAQHTEKEYTPQPLWGDIRIRYLDNGTIGKVKDIHLNKRPLQGLGAKLLFMRKEMITKQQMRTIKPLSG